MSYLTAFIAFLETPLWSGVAGLLGLVFTLGGFGLAWRQLRKVETATEAATKAALAEGKRLHLVMLLNEIGAARALMARATAAHRAKRFSESHSIVTLVQSQIIRVRIVLR